MHRLRAVKTLLVSCAFATVIGLSPAMAASDVGDRDAIPPVMTELQNINEVNPQTDDLMPDDALLSEDVGFDLRREAIREAALSYGARGGFARRTFEIMELIEQQDAILDKVFNFRRLLIQAPSGLLIEPPIVQESADALLISHGGVEAAVADKIYNIDKDAKIVTAPRDWRQYLILDWAVGEELAPPPKILWPKNEEEQAEWDMYVAKGWKEGYSQADASIEVNLNRLVADFTGMIRYRMLLAQGMISKPYALHEDRGVTGGRNVMRVGDRALRITGPSQFQVGSDQWQPADR